MAAYERQGGFDGYAARARAATPRAKASTAPRATRPTSRRTTAGALVIDSTN